MSEPNHYHTLDIPPSADLDAIKRAYRRKMRQHHPDQYAAHRETLRQKNDLRALRDLDRTIANAQVMTQNINAAYRILADAEAREIYDRDRLLKQQRATNAYRPPNTSTKRTAQARPTPNRATNTPPPRTNFHQSSASPVAESVPWAILGGFIVVLFIGFSVLSTFLGAIQQTSNYPTPIGFTAGELQATASARQATYVARTQIALAPTATPLNQNDLRIIADAFYRQGSFNLAVEHYTDALILDPDNPELYYLRALSHLGLANSPQDSVTQIALADFDSALILDSEFAEVYRERGLLYYARWLETRAEVDRNQSRADLNRYISVVPPDADVSRALNTLNDG